MTDSGILTTTVQRTTVNWKGVLWFLGIAYALAWLLELPMALDGKGLSSPWSALTFFVNFTPTIATLLVVRWISPLPNARKATGLRWGIKGTRWGWYWLFGLVGVTIFNVAAPFVGALFGQFPLDLRNFSGLKALLTALPGGKDILTLAPLSTIALVILVTLPLQALLICWINFGEEYGWRGYLLPQLLPLGQWPALVLSGAIWGFWHTPLILMGFDYPQHRVLGILLITVFGVIFGIILGWTRLATGSVWPAVLGHAALDANQVAGGEYILLRANAPLDTALGGITGITAWILPLLFIGLLVLTRRMPVRGLQSALADIDTGGALPDTPPAVAAPVHGA